MVWFLNDCYFYIWDILTLQLIADPEGIGIIMKEVHINQDKLAGNFMGLREQVEGSSAYNPCVVSV